MLTGMEGPVPVTGQPGTGADRQDTGSEAMVHNPSSAAEEALASGRPSDLSEPL